MDHHHDQGVSLLTRLRKTIGLDRLPATGAAALASPWAPRPTHLEPVIAADLFGDDAKRTITRADAMAVPALARARALITTTVARLPVHATRAGVPLDDQPRWIDRTDGPVSPFHRMTMTVDDLLFYGWSLWAVERDYDGRAIAADRVPIHRWTIRDDGTIVVDDHHVPDRDVCLIPGPHEGILTFGADTIRHAVAVLDAVARAAETPAAQVELHQTNDAPLTAEEADRIRQSWIAARRGRNGGVAFTTAGIEVRDHGAPIADLLVDGRNASAVDIARMCGIPASMVDATLSGSSLSYQNTASRMNELVTFGLAPFMAAIAGRLGMDDMVPRGVRIEFDMAETVAPISKFTVPDDDQPAALPAMDQMGDLA